MKEEARSYMEERHVELGQVAGAGNKKAEGGEAALLHQRDGQLLGYEAAHGDPGHMHHLLRPELHPAAPVHLPPSADCKAATGRWCQHVHL